MSVTPEQLNAWLTLKEDINLEFKEAKKTFDPDELTRYCVALSNEGGGHLVLGVTDRIPRKVVGTKAFSDLSKETKRQSDRLYLRIDAEELHHPDGRVVVFTIPPRPIGQPIEYQGAYLTRHHDRLVAMKPEQLKQIFNESGPDFSAEICSAAKPDDLEPSAITRLRQLWSAKSGNKDLLRLSDVQLLTDAGLLDGRGVPYAALILLGKEKSLARLLAQAEVIFDYRSSEARGSAEQREEYRKGFFLYDQDLWEKINLRNTKQHYQVGLFVGDVSTFNELAVREAILNAVSHRDYRRAGSVFVQQFASELVFTSPGGFPAGITPENVLYAQEPRNRRIAEVFQKCGLVERAGQGADRMFRLSLQEGKALPGYQGTDTQQVRLTLHGEVRDPRFVSFLAKLSNETGMEFSVEDLLVLDLLNREERVPGKLTERLKPLKERGALETAGRGRGTKYILSRRFYDFVGKPGTYSRKRGLDRGTNKELLFQHIERNGAKGTPLAELCHVLPDQTVHAVQKLVRELKVAGRVHKVGERRFARWCPGPGKPITPE